MAEKKDGYVVRIKIRDEQGNVVGETEAIAFKGLLAVAHDEGLRSVVTRLLVVPSAENGMTAIAFARVRTRRGFFTGIGDANPSNVNKRIAKHVIRMAETRAVARALRLAVNIGEVALEELAEDASAEPQRQRNSAAEFPARAEPATAGTGEAATPPERCRGRDRTPAEAAPNDRRAMSDEQLKLLYRLAFSLGESRETAGARVLKALGVERFEWATRVDASRAIDALKRETSERRGNGHGSEAGNGA